MTRPVVAVFVLICLIAAGGAYASRPCSTYWYDEFAYGQPTRPLNGNGGWTGSATDQILAWDNWCCVIVGGAGGVDAVTSGINYPGSGGVIWVETAIVGYNDNSNNMYNLWFDDELGRHHACISGSDNALFGKSGAITTAVKSLTDRAGHEINIKIDTNADTAEFFADGVSLGALSYPNGQSAKIDRIRFERVDSPAAAGAMFLIGELYVGTADTTPPPTPRAPFRPLTWQPNTSITFVWPPSRDACSGVAGYQVQVGTAPGASDVADSWIGNTTSYKFTGVSGVTYYCRVRSKDNAGNQSDWSETGSSSTAAPPPVMQVDGSPFFPLGYYTSTWFSSAQEAGDYLSLQHAQGMNAVLSCYGVWDSSSCMVSVMEGAALAGMKAAMEVHRYAVQGLPGYPTSLIDDQVDLLKAYPSFLGWYLIDEPEVQGVPPSLLQSRYAQIKGRDPNHSIWAVHYAYVGMNPERPAETYLAAEPPPYCDALMTDTYPVSYGSAEFGGALWMVALESKAHTDLAVSYAKETYLNVPQVQGWQDFNTRLPTYPEQRYLLYAPVVCGSRGLLLWMYNAFTTEDHKNNVVGPIAREISSLIPAVLSNSTAMCVTSSHDSDTTGHGIADVSYMFGQDSHGGYLIAVNNTANAVSVTFQLSGDVLSTQFGAQSVAVPVVFESRTVTAQFTGDPTSRTMTDAFSPYDVNVYRIYTLDHSVSIDLGSPDMVDGMSHPQTADGDTVAVLNMAGVNCRRNNDPGGSPPDSFFYFTVSDSFAFRGNNPDVDITVRYYDTGTGSLELQYDAAESPYKSGGSVALTATNTWKTHTFQVTDAYFGNRQNSGADFRISSAVGAACYIDHVGVVGQEPAAPGPVTGFTATPGIGKVTLAWTNPTDLFLVGTMIRCKTGSYPSSPTDGALLVDRVSSPGSSDSCVHGGFDNIRYYYTAFTYDATPRYTPAYASAAPLCGYVLDESFDAYLDGNLGGQGSWTTTSSASVQVQSSFAKGGTGKAVLIDPVASGVNSIGNEITLLPRKAGYYFVTLDVAQDCVGPAGYMAGAVNIYASDSATEIARVAIYKDKVVVQPAYTTSQTLNNNQWANVRMGFDIGTRKLDVWFDGVQKVSNQTWKGTGTDIAKISLAATRFSALTVQKSYVDNLLLEARPAELPVVRDDGEYTPCLDRLRFSFDPAPCATAYRYSVGTTAGATDVRDWTGCGASTDVTASDLTLSEGQRYYVNVQVGSGLGSWGQSTSSDGITVAPGAAIPVARSQVPDGQARSIRHGVVTAIFPGCFYIQDSDTPAGIKVMPSADVQRDNEVDVAGVLSGSSAERFIDCSNGAIYVTSPGPGSPDPVGITGASLGGGPFGLQEGVWGAQMVSGPSGFECELIPAVGLNNIGLLVRAWGKVTQIDPNGAHFYISDGSLCLGDGTKTGDIDNIGVRIACDGRSYTEGAFVLVTGISSCEQAGDHLIRLLRVADPQDIAVLKSP